MTVIRGDYGLIDLQAIRAWNRANQRAIQANQGQPTYRTTDAERASARHRMRAYRARKKAAQ